MIALIPVAGYATRLYPLTQDKPKALLEIGGKPMMDHVLEKILELPSVTRVIVVSNHKFADQFKKWAAARQKSVRVPLVVLDDGTTSNETRLGAIGDAQFAIEREHIDDDLVWVSGDNLFTFPLSPAFDAFNRQKTDIIACFDVHRKSEASKMGVVELDSNKRVIGFVEKPLDPSSTLASIGIYFYSRDTVKLFKKYLKTGNSPDKPGDFVAWLYTEKPVFGHVYGEKKDEWFDIGSLETLEMVRKKFR